MTPAASGGSRVQALQAYSFIQPLEGSAWPAHLTFVPTRDELYVPIVLRKPCAGEPRSSAVIPSGASTASRR